MVDPPGKMWYTVPEKGEERTAMAIIGIDLGTTNSLAAVWRNGRAELIPNGAGEYLTPSAVKSEAKRS